MILTGSAEVRGAGTLLSEPSTNTPDRVPRVSAEYTNTSDRFLLTDRAFHRQYAHLYAARLWTMRAKVEKSAKEKWGSTVPVRKLCELQAGEECVVVGTLFKHMQLKPSILHEISEEHGLMPLPPRSKYTDDSDCLILEDELQRINLVSNIDVSTSVTGVIIAVRGCEPEDDAGKFHVDDYCYQPLPKQSPLPEPDQDKYVCLVSGLELGGQMEQPLTTQLLLDLLTGQLGDPGLQGDIMAKVVRVVVAGNSLSADTQDKDSLTKAKYLTKNTMAGTVEAIKNLDDVLAQLAASMEVDVMAGNQDPVNYTLPQQPLHRCMFPLAGVYPTLHCVTNPYHFSVDGVSFLGTSGQPVNDMYKFCGMEDHLELLEKTLIWGHLAPTAPDTLGCYPYSDRDPFILEDCPHVYFAGNMPSFQEKIYEGPIGQKVRLITVPRFSHTQTCVLINLRTLQCQPISLSEALAPAATAESPEVDK